MSEYLLPLLTKCGKPPVAVDDELGLGKRDGD